MTTEERGKRPRILRPAGTRDENRPSPAPRPGRPSYTRDGQERPFRPRDDRYPSRGDNDRFQRTGDRPDRPYRSDSRPDNRYGDRSFNRHSDGNRDNRYGDRDNRYGQRDDRGGDRPYRSFDRGSDRPDRRSFDRSGDRPDRREGYGQRDSRGGYGADRGQRRPSGDRSYGDRSYGDRPYGDRPYGDRPERRPAADQPRRVITRRAPEIEEAELRLNRYIAKGGICSRRDADTLIQEGRVKVNGVVVDQVGVKVKREDLVEVDDVKVTPERKVYIILNKPKDYVTTVEDPMERKTVMNLIEGACTERVYPIGRLDRMTTGILLFTNDGDLAKKLTHPKYNQKKIYHVYTDREVAPEDLQKIRDGLELEDGFIRADDVQYASDDRCQIGIEIHSGKNRIVRRIFEHLGYPIGRLDRVYFAGITKKNLPRGKWRFLTREEVDMLKFY